MSSEMDNGCLVNGTMGVTITGQWVSGELDNGCHDNRTMGVTITGQWVSR